MISTNLSSSYLSVLILLCLPCSIYSHWWFMSQVYALGSKVMCQSTGLSSTQRQLCHQHPDAMISVAKGAKIGVEECQFQFASHRWNCSTIDRDTMLFGKMIQKGSRETAFVYAISSAGVVHEVTRSCSLGELKNCHCDNKRGISNKGFEWGGCSDNVVYGAKFSREFIDSRDLDQRDARALMNLHNNNVGRRAVRRHMLLDCKCHGVSGTCSVKTCWRSMSSFRQVGDYLREKFDSASEVSLDQTRAELMVANQNFKKPTRDDLVYLETSPDYCDPKPDIGVLGTEGRECNKSSQGPGGCEILCCGRGFDTIQVEEVYKCGCKFHWCCFVKCNSCQRTVDKHVCKGTAKPSTEPPTGDTAAIIKRYRSTRSSRKKKNRRNKKGKRRKSRKLKRQVGQRRSNFVSG